MDWEVNALLEVRDGLAIHGRSRDGGYGVSTQPGLTVMGGQWHPSHFRQSSGHHFSLLLTATGCLFALLPNTIFFKSILIPFMQ